MLRIGRGPASFGITPGVNYPDTGGYDEAPPGGFVTRLSPDGGSLVYSTMFYAGDAVALDADGAATVVGETSSASFPTTVGAFDTTYNGEEDIFVARLSPDGSNLVYVTLLGGSSDDWFEALAVDSAGAATIAGRTSSTDFPTTLGAHDTSHSGAADAFVTRLSPDGGSLIYSTLLGGTKSEGAHAIALDSVGATTVVGGTSSTDFPTTPGAYNTTHNGGGRDVFVTRLSPSGSSLVYSTFLGGALNEGLVARGSGARHAIALDAAGAATVLGGTTSVDFPTTANAYDATYNYDTVFNNREVLFFTQLLPDGSNLSYSTFLESANFYSQQNVKAALVNAAGTATIAVTGTRCCGSQSAPGFVAHFDLRSSSPEPFGTGCPGSAGVPTLAAAPGSLTNGTFAVELSSLPTTTNHQTFLVVGSSRDSWAGSTLPRDLAAIGIPGCTQYVSVDASVLLPPDTGTNTWEIPISVSQTLSGLGFYLQGVVVDFDPQLSGGSAQVSVTNALAYDRLGGRQSMVIESGSQGRAP